MTNGVSASSGAQHERRARLDKTGEVENVAVLAELVLGVAVAQPLGRRRQHERGPRPEQLHEPGAARGVDGRGSARRGALTGVEANAFIPSSIITYDARARRRRGADRSKKTRKMRSRREKQRLGHPSPSARAARRACARGTPWVYRQDIARGPAKDAGDGAGPRARRGARPARQAAGRLATWAAEARLAAARPRDGRRRPGLPAAAPNLMTIVGARLESGARAAAGPSSLARDAVRVVHSESDGLPGLVVSIATATPPWCRPPRWP